MKYWWLKLARYALPQWRGLLLIGLLMLLGIGMGLLAPWPLKLIVDNVMKHHPLPSPAAWLNSLPGAASPTGLLAWLAAATVGLFLMKQCVLVLQSYVKAGVGSRLVYGLAAEVFDDLQCKSLLFHHKHRTGDLIRRVTADTGCVRELVLQVYLPLLTSIISIFSMCIVMWQLSPALAVFAFVLIFPLALVIKFFARPMSQRKYEEWGVQGEISSLAEQTLSAIPIVQTFGRERNESRKFRRLAQRSVRASLRSEFSQHGFQVSTGSVTAIGAGMVMLVGGLAVVQGSLTVGSLLVLISYFAALYAPIETLAYLSEGFASAGAGARRVYDVLSADEGRIKDALGAKTLSASGHGRGIAVRFENVTFGYKPGCPVLQDISLTVEPGETIALVGPTGAGKSTLVSLIPRLFDPWHGTIYLGNQDIRQIQLFNLRNHIAIVPQEPFLLPLTIAENIAYARPDASREEIIAAATAAEADTFIADLPNGYNTIIGERGVTLSGGERQRLAIARAILKDAPILILDEPTASLDVRTESSLFYALDRLRNGKTTITIAHRMSTIRSAHRIVEIADGKITAVERQRDLLVNGSRDGTICDRQLQGKPALQI